MPTMKAVRLHRRGGPEQLIYEDAPKPTPGPGDALVRVHACAITPTELSWGTTYTTREGVERLPTIPGHELSGVVEAVAPDASAPKVGEAVYALTDFWRDGAAARASGTAKRAALPAARNGTASNRRAPRTRFLTREAKSA